MLKWKDTFSCNIAEIDNQHKRLFELGGKIFDAASLKDDYDHYDEIMEILNELTEYTVYHFKFEEDLMTKYGYSNFETHKFEHDFFVKKVQKIGKRDLEGAQNEALLEIVEFVANWVAEHILKTDMQYKDFFNSKGIY